MNSFAFHFLAERKPQMILFQNVDKRDYILWQYSDGVYDETKENPLEGLNNLVKIREFHLVYEPGSNKYPNMLQFIQDMAAAKPEFETWYINLLSKYKASNFDYKVLEGELQNLKMHCDNYLEYKNINFDSYINKSKASKNSIFFDADEIKKVIKTAIYLKVYYSIQRESELRLSQKFHKEAFQNLTSLLTQSAIIIKIHKIVSSKTFEYNHTDKYMWNYIRNLYCKTPEMHISHIFNFLVNNILVTCEIDSNPIPYIISVIDESIKWILKSIYKDTIVYSDSIATQDVNSVAGRDNLDTYAHNNTIGHLTVLANKALEELYENEPNQDAKVDEFRNTIETIKESSIFAEHFTYPILSRVLDIPYRHFLTLSSQISYLLNILLYKLTKDTTIEKDYPTLRKILLYYNIHKGITKTTYKMKNIKEFTDTFDNFVGFKNFTVPYDIYSSMVGKLIKNDYCDFITGNDIPNFPGFKMESELVSFYNMFFSGKMESLFDEIKEKIDGNI